jgi:hypothetical protein
MTSLSVVQSGGGLLSPGLQRLGMRLDIIRETACGDECITERGRPE